MTKLSYMKNKDILILANNGIFTATAHCLPPEHYYQWYKFKRDLKEALDSFAKGQADLMKEYGIVPGHDEQIPEVEKEKYVETFNLLLEDEVTVEVKARIPFRYYKELYDENNEVAAFKSLGLESIIIDTLFENEIVEE